ncbi:hypothetical protein BD779DRAFT_1476840 [Infundibulicybe gibba]|nr:hypothetical protein BD779DRAFT_1476840 [Infundibulicybe gibba]
MIIFLQRLPSRSNSNIATTPPPPIKYMAANCNNKARQLNTTELMMEESNQARKKAKSRRKRSKKVAQSNLATTPDDNDSELREQISALWVDVRALEAGLEAWKERSEAENALLWVQLDELKAGFATLVEDHSEIHAIRRGVLLDMGRNRVATVCGYVEWDSWLAASSDDRGQMYRQASAALAQVPLPRHWTDEALERLMSHHEPPRSLSYTIPRANRLNIEDSVLALPEGGQERKDMIAIFELISRAFYTSGLGAKFLTRRVFRWCGVVLGRRCWPRPTDLGLAIWLRESVWTESERVDYSGAGGGGNPGIGFACRIGSDNERNDKAARGDWKVDDGIGSVGSYCSTLTNSGLSCDIFISVHSSATVSSVILSLPQSMLGSGSSYASPTGCPGSGRRIEGCGEALWNDHERRRRASLVTLRRQSPR